MTVKDRWALAGAIGRGVLLLGHLAGGFIPLWLYALAFLCGVRGVCL